jgi:tetrahydromethanopterin S-methyltransferase subunit B
MLSNNFWYGFAIGVGIVLLIAIVPRLIRHIRGKKDGDS